jgi:putative endonuclease
MSLSGKSSVAAMKNNNSWRVYLLRCADGSLYCGITNNVEARLASHNAGKGAKYTQSRRPVELAGVSREMPKRDALRLEYHIKQLPVGEKIDALTAKSG